MELTKESRTPLFISPEILCAQKNTPANITEKTDVYSFGILLWEILTKQKAYSHHSNFVVFRRAILTGERPSIPSYCLPSLRNLLNACWAAAARDRPSFNEIVTALTSIVQEYQEAEKAQEVQSDIVDLEGTKFWIKYFAGTNNVSWEEFITAFCRELTSSDKMMDETEPEGFTTESCEIRCLQAVLVNQQTDMVTRMAFGKVLGWFGPLTFPFGEKHMLTRILQTLRLPYFHGSMSGGEASTLLSRHNPGSFLVRFSGNHPKSFCISRVDPAGGPVKHLVVPCKGGYFYYRDQPFASLDELAKVASTDLHLQCYCLSNKFKSLFDATVPMEPPISGYTFDNEDHYDL